MALFAAAAVLVAPTSPANALTYTFTSMVPSGFYTNGASNYPAINDLGQVASIGAADSSHQQVGLSDGSQTIPLLSTAPNTNYSVGAQLWLNNAGQATTNSFATFSSTTSTIVTASAGSTTTLPYPSGYWVNYGDFAAANVPNSPIVWDSYGASQSLFLTTGAVTQTLAVTGSTYGSFSTPYINAAGTVCFTSQTGTQTSVYSVTGGTIKRVSQSSNTSIGFGIDAAGDILWKEFLPGSNSRLWLTSPAGANTLIADTTTSAFSSFTDAYTNSISINDAGHLAFVATLKNGKVGVFTGPDPVANKVLEQGDPLFGGIAGSVFSIGSDALNNTGSIAFLANVQNQPGNFVIRADIATPEPASLMLLAAAAPFLLTRRR